MKWQKSPKIHFFTACQNGNIVVKIIFSQKGKATYINTCIGKLGNPRKYHVFLNHPSTIIVSVLIDSVSCLPACSKITEYYLAFTGSLEVLSYFKHILLLTPFFFCVFKGRQSKNKNMKEKKRTAYLYFTFIQ